MFLNSAPSESLGHRKRVCHSSFRIFPLTLSCLNISLQLSLVLPLRTRPYCISMPCLVYLIYVCTLLPTHSQICSLTMSSFPANPEPHSLQLFPFNAKKKIKISFSKHNQSNIHKQNDLQLCTFDLL